MDAAAHRWWGRLDGTRSGASPSAGHSGGDGTPPPVAGTRRTPEERRRRRWRRTGGRWRASGGGPGRDWSREATAEANEPKGSTDGTKAFFSPKAQEETRQLRLREMEKEQNKHDRGCSAATRGQAGLRNHRLTKVIDDQIAAEQNLVLNQGKARLMDGRRCAPAGARTVGGSWRVEGPRPSPRKLRGGGCGAKARRGRAKTPRTDSVRNVAPAAL